MSTEKKTRTKKVKEPVVVEHDPNDLNEVFMGYPDPPSLTLDEAAEPIEKLDKPFVEDDLKGIPFVEVEHKMGDNVHLYFQSSPKKEIPLEDQPIEQSIIKFIEANGNSHIKMNDFLRSLYPIPKLNEPSISLNQASSKEIRNILDKLSKEGGIEVVSNAHLHLGAPYYPDTKTMKTAYHNLNSVTLVVKKVN